MAVVAINSADRSIIAEGTSEIVGVGEGVVPEGFAVGLGFEPVVLVG